jgi:chemosensory pili system protein ChpA (sensor histidine kinase/response regulator)
MLSEQQQRILGYFIEEAKDHLNTIEQGLLNLQGTIEDPEAVSEVFRAAHSVKGGAAMLGLGSIQKTAHRLEDFFKVLKECPVQVDQQGENLFFDIFDGLKELLEQLQGPFGLTDDKAEEVMAQVEPKFTELGAHLNALVSAAGGAPPEGVELPPVGATPEPAPAPTPTTAPAPTTAPLVATEETSAMHLVFQSDVPARLRDMLQLFKQPDNDATREQLQNICQNLAQAGEQFDLPAWTHLINLTRRAIASPENTYRALAPVVIKDVKAAQDMVLTGRLNEIFASQALQAMVPVEEETNLTDTSDIEDLISSMDLEDSEETIEMIDFDLETEADLDGFEGEAEADHDDWLRGISESSAQTDASDLDLGLEAIDQVAEIPSPGMGDLGVTELEAEHQGPEVGMAELNSLADLFEGEVPELGATWEEEKVLGQPHEVGLGDRLDASNEFSDLFLDQDGIDDLALEDTGEDLSGLLRIKEKEAEPDEDLSDLLNRVPPSDELTPVADAAASAAPGIAEADDFLAQDLELLEVDTEEAPAADDLASLFEEMDDESALDISLNAGPEPTTADDTSQADDLNALFDEPSAEAETAMEPPFSFDEPEADITEATGDEGPGDELSDLFGAETDQDAAIDEDILAQLSTEAETDLDLADLFGEDASASGVIDLSDLEEAAAEDAAADLPDLTSSLELPDELFAAGVSDASAVSSSSVPDSEQSHFSLDDLTTSPSAAEGFELLDELGVDELSTPATELDKTLSDVEEAGAALESAEDQTDLSTPALDADGTDNEVASSEDNLDLDALLDSAGEESATLEALPPEAANNDDFAELDSLLSEAPDTDSVSAPSEPAANEEADFADLEALLGDDSSPVAATSGVDSDAGDDFADLEALLGDETPSLPPPTSPPVPVTLEKAPGSGEFDDLEKLLEDADQTLGGVPATRSGRSAAMSSSRRPARRGGMSEQNMRVSVKNLDNLNNLVGELVVNRNSLEQAEERLRQFLDNLLYQVQQLSDVGQRMRDLYERSLLESSLLSSRKSYQMAGQGSSDNSGNQSSHATGASFDALEMDRFTGFHTLSQEMIELIVRVRESASDIDFVVDETDQVTRNFRQITTQLQEGLNRSRMVPFAQTADRLPRAVRDISLKCGKQAELVVEGRDTLIDKMILEQLYDPMTHLVNNAITHGIETPEERTQAGKNPVGTITIRTFHQGNQTVISVTDDGAGINPENVKQKAIAKGVITAQHAAEMSRLDIYDLLFHHGFSTRDKADDFAGRGVGMDVVRTSLNEVRGTISIDSNVGQGTTFTIRLPLTLSISKALCCISNRARIAFPMDGVEDMLDVPKERIIKDNQDRPCIQWRDNLLPFHPLSELLRYNRSLGRGSVYGGNQEEDIISVVVLRGAGNFLALQVDQVLGEQEIVIKQLEGPVPKPTGVAGATVQGDGRIMPIADVLELIDLSMGRIRRDAGSSLWEKPEEEQPPAGETTDLRSEPTVLIVDDSITVRELLSMTFNKVGYRVEQARDGQEAWEKLRSGLPCDLVFCDIEMPRMDGLELLSRIQKDPSLNQLPIAMLTSRGADRHRQMAIQLGAKGYFTKPYLEEALLDAAQKMLKGEVLVHSNAG